MFLIDRSILHCDLNGFFASVECLYHPELRLVPMAICGDVESRHGIILAKNEPAKAFGIKTAETIWQAKQKCPELLLRPARHGVYDEFSKKINAIYYRFTELVEPFGIDESWLDVTASRRLFGSGKTIADTLRQTVFNELGLTISVGVSFNKIFAKLGSDYKKPDATTVISRENYREIVWNLPVSDLLFVGASTKDTLSRLGIHTIGELAQADDRILTAKLGKMGHQLALYARGEDDSPVLPIDYPHETKSLGNHMTFSRNLLGLSDIKTGVLALCDTVAARLRRHGLQGRTVCVTIKDPQLKQISRQRSLPIPTDLARELTDISMEIIKAGWDVTQPIRMLSVTVSGFEGGDSGEQLSLFAPTEPVLDKKRTRKLETAIDSIRDRFGSSAVSYATILNNDIGIHTGDDAEEKNIPD